MISATAANKYWNLPTICKTVISAGLAGLGLQQKVLGSGTQKEDRSLVTEADLAVENILKVDLQNIVPDASFLAEESIDTQDPAAQLAAGAPIYIIDPIDGTAVFAAGLPGWGVSLGLALDGELAEGAVFTPGTGELFISSQGRALYRRFPLNDRGIPQVDLDDSTSLAASLQPLPITPAQPVKLLAITQYIAKGPEFAVPYTLVSTASAVVSMLGTARGGFRGYVVKAKIWDIAGAWPILRGAGVRATLISSQEKTDLELNDGPWIWDRSSYNFLSTEELILMTRDDDVEAAVLALKPRHTY